MSAFIKKTKSRSGATVIQVVFKHGRQVTKLMHVGTAHSKAEEAELRSVAQDIIHEGQMTLDLFETDPTGLDLVLENTYSATLWQALSFIYDLLGFSALRDETFKQLVLARIIEPTSKLDTIRVIDDLGLAAPANSQIHRTLAKIREDDYRGALSKACFEGNRAEVKTIMEVLGTFKTRHGIDDLTVTADAAMLSSANIWALEDAGYHYIIGSRIAKTPYEIVEYAKTPGQELEDMQIFDLKVDMNTGKGDKRIKRRVIYQYRQKRASMDLLNIDKLLAKAERMVAGQAELKRNRFVTIKDAKKEINYGLVEASRLKAGIKGYVTDLDIPAQEVIDAYHQLLACS